MADKAYRSLATGNWNNSTGTIWAVYSGTWNGTSFNAGTWSTAAANDYPTASDFVWIQGANVVTYDTTAISAIGTSTLKQISRQTAVHASYSGTVAQPGTGGSDATTGYIAISTTGVQSLKANYNIIGTGLTSTTGLFTVSTSTITLTIGATSGVSSFCEGTGVSNSLVVVTGLTNTTVNMTSSTDLKSGGTSANIRLVSATTLNLSGNVDLTNSTISLIDCFTGQSSITVTGNLQGSNSGFGAYCITATNTTTTPPTAIINGNVLAGTQSPCINIPVSSTNYVQVSGNVRNYGIASGSISGQHNAIVGTSVRMTSTTSEIRYNIGGETLFRVGSSTSTASEFWNVYQIPASPLSGTFGALIKSYLDTTVSSRATQTSVDTLATYVDTEVASIKTATDRIPTNPSSIESVGSQLSSLFP
jgi:hypothetical protein